MNFNQSIRIAEIKFKVMIHSLWVKMYDDNTEVEVLSPTEFLFVNYTRGFIEVKKNLNIYSFSIQISILKQISSSGTL